MLILKKTNAATQCKPMQFCNASNKMIERVVFKTTACILHVDVGNVNRFSTGKTGVSKII